MMMVVVVVVLMLLDRLVMVPCGGRALFVTSLCVTVSVQGPLRFNSKTKALPLKHGHVTQWLALLYNLAVHLRCCSLVVLIASPQVVSARRQYKRASPAVRETISARLRGGALHAWRDHRTIPASLAAPQAVLGDGLDEANMIFGHDGQGTRWILSGIDARICLARTRKQVSNWRAGSSYLVPNAFDGTTLPRFIGTVIAISDVDLRAQTASFDIELNVYVFR